MDEDKKDRFIRQNEEVLEMAKIMVNEGKSLMPLIEYISLVSVLFAASVSAFAKTFTVGHEEEFIEGYLNMIKEKIVSGDTKVMVMGAEVR